MMTPELALMGYHPSTCHLPGWNHGPHPEVPAAQPTFLCEVGHPRSLPHVWRTWQDEQGPVFWPVEPVLWVYE